MASEKYLIGDVLMEINSQTIPAWFVSMVMILTGLMWIISRRVKIVFDSRIFAYTFVAEGLVYGIIFQLFSIDTETRGFFSRLMIIVLCLAQYIPLLVSYLRSKKGE